MKIEIAQYLITPANWHEARIIRDALDMAIDCLDGSPESLAVVAEIKRERVNLPHRRGDFAPIELSIKALAALETALQVMIDWSEEPDADAGVVAELPMVRELMAAVEALTGSTRKAA